MTLLMSKWCRKNSEKKTDKLRVSLSFTKNSNAPTNRKNFRLTKFTHNSVCSEEKNTRKSIELLPFIDLVPTKKFKVSFTWNKTKMPRNFSHKFWSMEPNSGEKTHERIHSLYETRYTSACNNISFSRSLFTVNVLCCLCIAYLLSWNRWFLWMNRQSTDRSVWSHRMVLLFGCVGGLEVWHNGI